MSKSSEHRLRSAVRIWFITLVFGTVLMTAYKAIYTYLTGKSFGLFEGDILVNLLVDAGVSALAATLVATQVYRRHQRI